jgi:hypothetical protein
MKKTWTLIALMAGAAGGFAQGTVCWSDYVGDISGHGGNGAFSIDIWSPSPANPTVEQIGNAATDASPNSGTTIYNGAPRGGSANGSGPTAYGNGNAWTIALYASTSSFVTVALTTADEVASSTFFAMGGTGAANKLEDQASGGGGFAGGWTLNFDSASLTVLPGTTSGNAGSAQVQLAAWYSGGGATSYAAAVMAGLPAGTSEVGNLNGLGGANAGGPPSTTPDLSGLGITSFSLAVVPEPSTMVLGVIGAIFLADASASQGTTLRSLFLTAIALVEIADAVD